MEINKKKLLIALYGFAFGINSVSLYLNIVERNYGWIWTSSLFSLLMLLSVIDGVVEY